MISFEELRKIAVEGSDYRFTDMVKRTFNQYNEDRDLKIAELEAKVYTYEQFIAKSNFAPVLGMNVFTNEELQQALSSAEMMGYKKAMKEVEEHDEV